MALAVAQTQSAVTTANATTRAFTWAGNTTTGNLIVVAIASGITGPVQSIADSQSNTYTLATGTVGNLDVEIWYAKNITGGTTPTVTVTSTGSQAIAVVGFEISGAQTVSPLDKIINSTPGASTNSFNLVSEATTQNNEIVIYIHAIRDNTNTVTGDAGYTNTNVTTTGSATNTVGVAGYKIITSKGTQSITSTSSGNDDWQGSIATFKDVDTAGGPRNLSFSGVAKLRPAPFKPGNAR